jgi:hypothetical protein
VKIVERLTKGESKKNKKNKSHAASFIVVEVGGTSTFVTHDVTKVEVRWAETLLKLQSHAPRERGCLTPQTSAGLSCPGPARALAAQARAKAGHGLALPAQGRAWAWPWPYWPRAGPGPSHGPSYGRGPKILTFPILDVFLVFHRFSILVLVFHIVHMYFFETWFSCSLSLFLYSNLRFGDFVQIGSIDYFFFDMYFF